MTSDGPEATNRMAYATLWNNLAQIGRRDIFNGEYERHLPLHNPIHAELPALGWVGSGYPTGGLVIVGANPGGGGDSYTPAPGDEDLYAGFAQVKEARSAQEALAAFDRMSALYLGLTMGHNISLPLREILKAAGATADQCAFLNVLPFRTRGDKWPGTAVRTTAVRRFLVPQLTLLRPARLVLLGMKAIEEAERHLSALPAQRFHIPRRIGDRALHPAAVKELERLGAEPELG